LKCLGPGSGRQTQGSPYDDHLDGAAGNEDEAHAAVITFQCVLAHQDFPAPDHSFAHSLENDAWAVQSGREDPAARATRVVNTIAPIILDLVLRQCCRVNRQ